jgi:hypothetical protein
MLRDSLANMLRGFFIAHPREMAQSHIADIFIETMLLRIAVPVGFIGAHRMFIPFAGKHALPANRFKTVANTADTGKQIDEAEPIMRMMRRRLRQEREQVGLLLGVIRPAARATVATRLRIAGLQCCSPTAINCATSVLTSYIAIS